MECIRCGNKDPTYFYLGSKGCYCRKCIKFSRILLEEELEPLDYIVSNDASDYHFKYELTSFQKEASNKCLSFLKEDYDVLLNCVCGAGKTEIVVKSISEYLALGLKVCYAIARKEVVIELEKRFKSIFPNANVVGVYGGHHSNLTGDLIVCTDHQLYRYYKTFDLLILDEVDAFPLKGNETLMNIALNSASGKIIFSTATVDQMLINILSKRKYKEVNLYVRPSNKPLCIPRVLYFVNALLPIYLTVLMHKITNQCIIFVSSTKQCVNLYKIFSHLYSCTYVYAELDTRNQNIKAFKDKKYQFIFATSVLERGITISGIEVIVIDNKNVFDEANIIQMLGRVGRDINNSNGRGYLLINYPNKKTYNVLTYLKKANGYL